MYQPSRRYSISLNHPVQESSFVVSLAAVVVVLTLSLLQSFPLDLIPNPFTWSTLPNPLLFKPKSPSFSNQRLLSGSRRNSVRVTAISKKWEPTKVIPQADRVLVRLEELPEKSGGGVMLPKSAVKFVR